MIKNQNGTVDVFTQEEPNVFCELCNKNFQEASEFILHCEKDKSHKDLVNQFTDEVYDSIFEQLDKRAKEKNEFSTEKIENQFV